MGASEPVVLGGWGRGGQTMRGVWASKDAGHRDAAVPVDGRGTDAPGQFPRSMKFVFWILVAIAVAAATRRAVALFVPAGSGPPQLVALDRYFRAHAALTGVHIGCATVLVVLLPFVFRRRVPISVERALFVAGAIVGVTAYAMSVDAVGGWLERSAVFVFNTLFLCSLACAFVFAQRGELAEKRRWLLRATAILLGIATTRPVMGVFFATAPLTHLAPRQFFGIAFWIGWTINTLGIELWLRAHRGAGGGQV
jgi:hypothetical protein